MNPALGIVLSSIVAALLLFGGAWLGAQYGIEERRTLLTDLTDARRELVTARVEAAAAYKSADGWREASKKWREHYLELIGIRSPRVTKPAANDDPPTVGQADRRAMESRRAREEREETDRLAIALRDDDAAPPPRLRDAADDH